MKNQIGKAGQGMKFPGPLIGEKRISVPGEDWPPG